jgi:uncharacterized membrane protein|tara:strand:+ start:2584 stop:3111 length:528 start_codon:yes stop_codon:yes gene_type:complete
MSSLVKKSLLLILFGTVLHLTFIAYYPTYKMWEFGRSQDPTSSVNKIFHGEKINSNSRKVIRPSPDLLYSGCGYDVTYSPVVITSKVLNTYWAMSFYSANSDNFAILNDLDIDSEDLKVYLFGPNSKPIKITDGFAIFSPTDKGVMLIRRFIGNEDNIEEMYRNQETLTCNSLIN